MSSSNLPPRPEDPQVDDKDDRDLVIFYKDKYYHLPFSQWTTVARELGQGEQTVLVPLVETGALGAHVDEDSPKFGTWTNLVNLEAILRTCTRYKDDDDV